MSDAQAPDTETTPEAPAAKPKKRLPLLIIAAVASLAAIGAGVYFSGVLGDGAEPSQAEHDPAKGDQTPAGPTVFFAVPDLVVSLNTGDRRPMFLKLRVTIEVASEAEFARIQTLMPRVLDHCQVYLRELRPEDLQGSAGTMRLKEELLRRIKGALAPSAVHDLLFSELLIQ
jgi:flagellar FliL protein